MKKNYIFAIRLERWQSGCPDSYREHLSGTPKEIVRKIKYGEMAERLIAPVLKTGLGKTNGGSNPSLSAECIQQNTAFAVFLIYETRREKPKLLDAERNQS